MPRRVPAQSKSRAPKSRLIKGTKMSDAEIDKLIRCYALGLSAAEARMHPKYRVARSSVTIYEVYGLIRKRLLEIGYYSDYEDVMASITPEDEAANPSFYHSFFGYLIAGLAKRRGIRTNEQAKEHLSELHYRFYPPDPDGSRQCHDIRRIIRITGPLNVPPSGQAVARWKREHLQRIEDRIAYIERRRGRFLSDSGAAGIEAGERIGTGQQRQRSSDKSGKD